MRTYRHKLTGLTAQLPDTGFYRNHPHLEVVDGPEDCKDCGPVVSPVVESLVFIAEDEEEKDEG